MTDEGLAAKIYRFGVYLFVPNGNNQEGTPAEEQCEEAEQTITALLKGYIPAGAVEEVQFSSAREYRYGRGYYIYEIQYQFAIFDESEFTGNYTLSFYHANIENQDMTYGYEKTLLTECFVDREHGINRSPDGLAHNDIITIRYCGEHVDLFSSADLRINTVAGHDFIVLGDVNLISPVVVTSVPTATSENVGTVILYNGTTTQTYTHGSYYKNIATKAVGTAIITQSVGEGLSNLVVNVSVFENKINTTGTYLFTFNGEKWLLNGNSVILSDYGISYSGVAVENDVLSIVYSEGLTTYTWTELPNDSVLTDKQSVINAGYEVFEINTIRPYFDKEHNCIAVELVGN